jgi:beta-glucosidase-like glycosyl hydrolase
MSEAEITTESTEPEAVEPEAPDLGDAGKKAIEAEREARKAAEKAAREAKKTADAALARVKEFEDRDKTETQKAAERIAELEKALADKETALALKDQDILRRDVAKDKKVPVKFVIGSTREEMEAAAEEFLQESQQASSERKPLGALRSGASATNSADPKEKVAQAIRALAQNR